MFCLFGWVLPSLDGEGAQLSRASAEREIQTAAGENGGDGPHRAEHLPNPSGQFLGLLLNIHVNPNVELGIRLAAGQRPIGSWSDDRRRCILIQKAMQVSQLSGRPDAQRSCSVKRKERRASGGPNRG